MTKSIGEMIAVMQAFQDGKAIQSKRVPNYASGLGEGEWGDDDSPTWAWAQRDYRVKSVEPRRVWINEYVAGPGGVFFSLDSAFESVNRHAASPFLKTVEFIEVTETVRAKLGL